MRKTLAHFKVGSHLYGLNRPESDEDYMGVFLPTSADLLGLHPINEVDNSTKSSSSERRNTAGDVDDKMYSLPKFLHLSLQNNPNIIEVFFATKENTLEMTPTFQELIDNVDKIISKKVFHTFKGYAFSQKKKLTVKSERYGSLVESVHDMEKTFSEEELHDTKRAITEEESVFLNKTLKYYKGRDGNTESFHKGMPLKTIYEKLVEERDNYGWRVKTDTFDELGYDVKFGYHLIRILAEGYQLLSTGRLEYPISGSAREDIIRVRSGNVELKELLQMYEKYDTMCKEAYETTTLRQKPDMKWADTWLVNTLKHSIMEE